MVEKTQQAKPMASTQRKNVTTACKACRETKTKCDGATPQCANCVRRGRQCYYEAREDRRKLSFRPTLAALRRRVEVLHDELLKVGVSPPPMEEDEESLANRTLEGVGLPKLPTQMTPLPTSDYDLSSNQAVHIPDIPDMQPTEYPVQGATGYQTQDVGQEFDPHQADPTTSFLTGDQTMNGTSEDAASLNELFNLCWDDSVSPDWPWAGGGLLAPEIDPTAGPLSFQGNSLLRSKTLGDVPGETIVDTSTAVDGHDDEMDPEIVGQIAARFGSLRIAPDGKLRYFGTAAHAHLFNSGIHSGLFVNPRSIKSDGRRLLSNAGLDQPIEPEFENHLIRLFFSWHNACHAILDENVYWSERNQYGNNESYSNLYSEVLTNAMCAIGASYETRYHSSLVTFPRPLAEFFAERAKVLLEIELDSPCVSTVQSLLLLSSHEASYQRTARSWLYSGMAMRLCFDIGLHIDATPYVEQDAITAEELLVRQMTFWAAFVINYRTSFSLGRPFTLDASEIGVRRPDSASRASHGVWRPYFKSSRDSGIGESPPTEGTPDHAAFICEQRIRFCEIVEPIVRALYGDMTMSAASLQELSEKATTALFNWKDGQSDAFRMSDDPQYASPGLMALHMEYHYLQILLHRPWTSRRLQPIPAKGRGFRHARQTCIDSACEMARILLVFEERFGYRHLDVETSQMLPSAALVLVFATVSRPKEDSNLPDVLSHLNTFLRALDELSSIHASVRQQLNSVLLTQERWRTLHQKQLSKRREEVDVDANDVPHSKRIRWSG